MPSPAGRSGRSSTSRRPRRGPCCGRVSRGLAILGDTLFMGTIDAHLLAIDAKTGKILWDIEAAKLGDKPPKLRHHPRAARREGQDHRRRRRRRPAACAASSPRSTPRPARKLWRFYTIPGPGENGQRDLVGRLVEDRRRRRLEQRRLRCRTRTSSTSAPAIPRRTGTAASRLGDNLYSDSVVALDADTGKLKWHYQFTPHDEVDYDSTQVPDPRRHAVAGPAAQGDAVGQSQRPRLRAGPRHRRVPARQAVRQSELDGRIRQERPAAARPRQDPDARRAS